MPLPNPTRARQVQAVLVRHGERSGPGGEGVTEDGDTSGRKSPSASTGRSPGKDAGDGSSKSKESGGNSANQPAATKPKPKKDWVRFEGPAMLLSSAGWSDDEDEEKEELITSEIEKFRQKQVTDQ